MVDKEGRYRIGSKSDLIRHHHRKKRSECHLGIFNVIKMRKPRYLMFPQKKKNKAFVLNIFLSVQNTHLNLCNICFSN